MAYQNDPAGALIQFSSPDEAKRAKQSTEAVLNNRFIRVHWFREDGSEPQGQSKLQQPSQPQVAAVNVNCLSKEAFANCPLYTSITSWQDLLFLSFSLEQNSLVNKWIHWDPSHWLQL